MGRTYLLDPQAHRSGLVALMVNAREDENIEQQKEDPDGYCDR
jgi:hypothetical protein